MNSATDARDISSHVVFFPPSGSPLRSTETACVTRAKVFAHAEREHETLDEGAEEGAFLAWLLSLAGLAHRDYRALPLLRRLPACLRAVEARSVREARLRLEARPELVQRALAAVVIGVTFFFRDTHVFDRLSTETLPRLLKRRSRLRIWSAGCADGSELYSAAMLLAEAGALDDCTLLGNDCRPGAVAKAAAGVFHEASLDGVSDARLARHFTRRGEAYIVHDSIRSRARFAVDNLLSSAAASETWDVIFCRNVAIYLQPVAAERMWARLAGALVPGGVLVTGKAERPAGCALRRVGDNFYQKGEA